MAIDWDNINSQYEKKYKDYAPEGDYTTKLESVEMVTAKTGNTGIRFNLKETEDYKFPKYGVTFYNTKNESFRQHHMKEIFIVLGMTEEQARKSVEACEGKSNVMDAYQKLITSFLPKQKEFEISVFKENPGDKYTTWDFKSSSVRMKKHSSSTESTPSDDFLSDGETVEISDDEFPFD